MTDLGLLSIGTANWGQSYGSVGGREQLHSKDIAAVLSAAREAEISHIDTAIDYGDAESILGDIGVADFVVTTKLPAVTSEIGDVRSWFRGQVEDSLERLKLTDLGCVLLHRPEQLTGSRGAQIAEALFDLRTSGLARKVGISIYEPEILEEINDLGVLTDIDVVQAPMNAFDRRLVESGWSSRLIALDVEIEVRSIFLQGLLVTPIAEIPPALANLSSSFKPWWTYVETCGQTAVSAALGAVSQMCVASRIIVGVQSLSQLVEVVSATRVPPANRVPEFDVPAPLLDPRQWPV